MGCSSVDRRLESGNCRGMLIRLLERDAVESSTSFAGRSESMSTGNAFRTFTLGMLGLRASPRIFTHGLVWPTCNPFRIGNPIFDKPSTTMSRVRVISVLSLGYDIANLVESHSISSKIKMHTQSLNHRSTSLASTLHCSCLYSQERATIECILIIASQP